MDAILGRLARYQPFTTLVVGDYMLDEQHRGAAERLSPEAPVPILHATEFEHSPGGAANVALCLRELKSEVLCVGVVGDDKVNHDNHAAQRLQEALVASGCDVSGFIVDSDRPTTIKRSFVGLAQHRHPQKMFRVDIESCEPLGRDVEQALLEHVRNALSRADVVCIEDYNKGVCTETICQSIIGWCRAAGKPVLVDPAAITDYSKYRGATAMTPNRTEAELATGLGAPLETTPAHNQAVAERLLTDLKLDAVILTLDKDGALLARPGHDPVAVPTNARSVYDVSGAGDMVLAAIAGAVANDFSWEHAVRFANAAAALEVEQFGVKPIPFARVQREVLAQVRQITGKVRTLEELVIELNVHRNAGHTIVLTNGCFDVVHAGHVNYLQESRSLGDVLVVGVNSDAQARALKGEGRPVYTAEERLHMLEQFEFVDYLIVFNEPTAHTLLDTLRPHIYTKGGDYKADEVAEHDLISRLIEAGELEFRIVGEVNRHKSTDVAEKLGMIPLRSGKPSGGGGGGD